MTYGTAKDVLMVSTHPIGNALNVIMYTKINTSNAGTVPQNSIQTALLVMVSIRHIGIAQIVVSTIKLHFGATAVFVSSLRISKSKRCFVYVILCMLC